MSKLKNQPCPWCGARRGFSVWESGWGHCFACSKNVKVEEGTVVATKDKVQDWSPVQIERFGIAKRGLNEETCKHWNYGVGEFQGQKVQVANYYSPTGELVAQKLRFADKNFRILGDWSRVGLYGQHLWRDAGKMLVVTEGEIDALSVSQVQQNKWPVVSIPGGASAAKKALAAQLEWLERFEVVVLMFDMDAPGQKAAQECAELLSPQKGRIARLSMKDANELLQAGKNKEIIDAIWGARPYRPDGIVGGDDVWEILCKDERVEAAEFPHQGLNALTYGMRPRELITITAGTGIGKSTFCREVGFALAQSGNKVGYIALEESVKRSALGFCSIALNKPLHLNMSVDQKALHAAFDSFKDRVFFYDHYGSIEAGNLLAKMRYMVKGCGCTHLILDHLTIAISGLEVDDERRGIDKLMTQLSSLAQETEACILLVSHLRRSEGRPHEEGKPVTLADLRGSHGIAQNSRTIISLERNQQSEDEDRDITLVRVLKCTHTGMTGRAGYLRYHRDTGRLTEYLEDGFEVEDMSSKREEF